MIVSERVVGYFLTNPCVVKILTKETESGEKDALQTSIDSLDATYN